MSKPLYYWDAYRMRFDGVVIEAIQDNGRTAIILDQTFFYPTSGGQPHDTGYLAKTAVSEVTLRETDGAILHWLAEYDDTAWQTAVAVTGQINWPRRFDHMQQHSGQHILSQAFLRVADAQTISFHLGPESVTIDLDSKELTDDQLTAAETLANQVIWENRPIHIREVSMEEALQLNLRKIPATDQDKLRLIDIEDFDLTACGGTHVAHTGAVGLLKIIKLERIRGQVRVVFCCGHRALSDYRHKHDVLQEIGTHLTTSYAQFPQTIQSLQDTLKHTHRAYKQQTETLIAFEVTQLRKQGFQHGPFTLVTQVFITKDAGQLRSLANHLTQHPGVVAFLGLAGEKSFLLFSRAADAPGDMNALLQEALQQVGGRGGGTAVTAQGGGSSISETTLQAILGQTKNTYLALLP